MRGGISFVVTRFKIEPKNVLALRAASNLYLKNGLHNKALPLLEALCRQFLRQPMPTRTWRQYMRQAVIANVRKKNSGGRWSSASGYFPALAGLGNLLARAGDDAAAMPLLRRAKELQPRAYEGHFLLGSALNRSGQFAEARTELEQASKLGGENNPQVFYQLARAWGGVGNATERKNALTRFSELTKKEKDNTQLQRQATVWIDEARALLQAGAWRRPPSDWNWRGRPNRAMLRCCSV